ncbi:hypothetical protein TNCV_4067681 [Trichonephila clavipes]|nr:hypothetical protein TNCV_4067681 [Trichonephila clavipes]
MEKFTNHSFVNLSHGHITRLQPEPALHFDKVGMFSSSQRRDFSVRVENTVMPRLHEPGATRFSNLVDSSFV